MSSVVCVYEVRHRAAMLHYVVRPAVLSYTGFVLRVLCLATPHEIFDHCGVYFRATRSRPKS
jgi:hypothetical protein